MEIQNYNRLEKLILLDRHFQWAKVNQLDMHFQWAKVTQLDTKEREMENNNNNR